MSGNKELGCIPEVTCVKVVESFRKPDQSILIGI